MRNSLEFIHRSGTDSAMISNFHQPLSSTTAKEQPKSRNLDPPHRHNRKTPAPAIAETSSANPPSPPRRLAALHPNLHTKTPLRKNVPRQPRPLLLPPPKRLQGPPRPHLHPLHHPPPHPDAPTPTLRVHFLRHHRRARAPSPFASQPHPRPRGPGIPIPIPILRTVKHKYQYQHQYGYGYGDAHGQ